MTSTALHPRTQAGPHARLRAADAAPEWGPAKHDPEHPFRSPLARSAAGGGVALRDGDEARPDDN